MKEMIVNGEKITIRESLKSDARAVIEYLHIIGGESDFLTFGAGEFEMSVEEEKVYIENTNKRQNAISVVAEINGRIVGNLNFSGGPRQRTAHVGEFGVSVLMEYWGNGIGEEMIKYLISWSKNSGIIRKINLRTRADNTRGINLYKKLGFTEEGLLARDFYINGEFYDSLAMGMLID